MYQFAFTIDFDWASDDVLQYALKAIFDSNIPITLFSTHNSEWISQIVQKKENVEIEIHPNFCKNSSHGDSLQKVFDYCETIYSEKIGFRCHRYYNSNDIQEHYKQIGYKYSSNICTDLQCVKPFYNRVGLMEIPIFMEDGGFMYQKHTLCLSEITKNIPDDTSHTLVFLFHPMHIAFNSNNFHDMKVLKQNLKTNEYQNINTSFIEKRKNQSYGIQNLFEDLFNWSEQFAIKKVLMKNIYEEYK